MPDPFIVRRIDETHVRPAPVCEACGKTMWWNGSTDGWGCPVPMGDPLCRSRLHRPKPEPAKPWRYEDRYPELVGDTDPPDFSAPRQ